MSNPTNGAIVATLTPEQVRALATETFTAGPEFLQKLEEAKWFGQAAAACIAQVGVNWARSPHARIPAEDAGRLFDVIRAVADVQHREYPQYGSRWCDCVDGLHSLGNRVNIPTGAAAGVQAQGDVANLHSGERTPETIPARLGCPSAVTGKEGECVKESLPDGVLDTQVREQLGSSFQASPAISDSPNGHPTGRMSNGSPDPVTKSVQDFAPMEQSEREAGPKDSRVPLGAGLKTNPDGEGAFPVKETAVISMIHGSSIHFIAGHWNGAEWYLARVKKDIKTGMGQAFAAYEWVLARNYTPEEEERYHEDYWMLHGKAPAARVLAYSVRNRVDTSIAAKDLEAASIL
jgi:hypothetical protein